ncbi:MAG: hypothetical protein ABS76_06860 [Pelagibacterium sp. SCN 64-44]|nr:MAG: hypothetical protein ABS76_06860 [Pelagibacterium sp. SCN 64-44]
MGNNAYLLAMPEQGTREMKPDTTKPQKSAREEFSTARAFTMLAGLLAGAAVGAALGPQANLAGALVGALLGAAAGATIGISIWH